MTTFTLSKGHRSKALKMYFGGGYTASPAYSFFTNSVSSLKYGFSNSSLRTRFHVGSIFTSIAFVYLKQRLPRRLTVDAEVARATTEGRAYRWDILAHEHGFELYERGFNPAVVARIRDKDRIELELAVEGLRVAPPVHIDEVAGRRDREAVPAEEPLIDLHLSLVGGVEVLRGPRPLLLARGLVVYDEEFTGGCLPHVIDAASDDEIGRFVMVRDASPKRVAPLVKTLVSKRDCVQVIVRHQGMPGAVCSMNVKFA